MQVVFGFLRCSSAAIFFVKGKSIGDALAVFQIVLERVQGGFTYIKSSIHIIISPIFFSPLLRRK
jgi:hypothetical protein